MSRFSPRLKRCAVIVLLCAGPLLLFAFIREKRRWQPRTLPVSTMGSMGQVLWMPDGKTLLVQTDLQLQFWDVNRQQLSRTVDLPTSSGSLTLLPDNKLAYKPRGLVYFCIWDLQKQKDVSTLDLDYIVDFVPEHNQIINSEIKDGNIELKFLDLRGRLLKKQQIKPYPNTSFDKHFYDWLISPDASLCVVEVFHKANGKLAGLMFVKPHNAKTYLFLPQTAFPMGYEPYIFLPDSKTLLIRGEGGCQLRDARTGRLKTSINDARIIGHFNLILPDGNQDWLLGWSGVLHDTIFVWNTATGKLLREIKADKNVHDIALSPDGATLAVSTQNSVKLYRMR